MKHLTRNLLALCLALALLGTVAAPAEQADIEKIDISEQSALPEGIDLEMPGIGDLELSLSGDALESEAPAQSTASNTIVQSGMCGDNVKWELDSDGLLTLSGSGDMDNNFAFWSLFIEGQGIRAVVVNEGVTSIGVNAFNGCKELESVSLPDSLNNIWAAAFLDCIRLRRIDIPDGIPFVAGYAFARCYSLEVVNLPESVTEIVDHAFEDCVRLQTLDLPRATTSIETSAFKGCSGLESILVPENVSMIAADAFDDCPRLTIRGYSNTIAESYAQSHGIPFTSLGSVSVSGIKLNKHGTVGLKIGKTLQLKATPIPAGANVTLNWKSNTAKVATVSQSGKVKAVGKGTATVTVSAGNGASASVKIKVTAPSPTKIAITKGKTAKLKVGKKLTLKVKLTPSYAESKLTWSSSNKAVATVSSKGVVTAKKAGTAKITVRTANKKKAVITIKVVK